MSTYASAHAQPSRAALRTRPLAQRVLIRSWEYNRPVRIAILAIRLLVAPWLLGLGAALYSAGDAWGVAMLPAALVVLLLSRWIFTTAAKGWPAAGA